MNPVFEALPSPPGTPFVEHPGSVAGTASSLPPAPEGAAHSSDQLTPDQLQKVAATINNTARPSLQANEQYVSSMNQDETDLNETINELCNSVENIEYGRAKSNTLSEEGKKEHATEEYEKYLEYTEVLRIDFEKLLNNCEKINGAPLRNLQNALCNCEGRVYRRLSKNPHLQPLYDQINEDRKAVEQLSRKFNEHQKTLKSTPQVNGNDHGCPPLVSSNTFNPTQPKIDSSSSSDRFKNITKFCRKVARIETHVKPPTDEEKRRQHKEYQDCKRKHRIDFTQNLHAEVGSEKMMELQGELQNLTRRICKHLKKLESSQEKNQASMQELLSAFKKEVDEDYKNSFQSSKVQTLKSDTNNSLSLKRSANNSFVGLSLPVSKKNKEDVRPQNSHSYSHLAPRQDSLEQKEREELMRNFLPSLVPPTRSAHSPSNSNSFAFPTTK